MKKLDILEAHTLAALINGLNTLGIQKDDLVNIFLPTETGGKYKALFYYGE